MVEGKKIGRHKEGRKRRKVEKSKKNIFAASVEGKEILKSHSYENDSIVASPEAV
jgi:hypothetical protein